MGGAGAAGRLSLCAVVRALCIDYAFRGGSFAQQELVDLGLALILIDEFWFDEDIQSLWFHKEEGKSGMGR